MSRPIRIIAHTHWDREWYLSFGAFREKLVATLDLLLDLLEREPTFTHFHLDGQTAMIDDYLSVRPERAEDLSTYIAAGRLSCGPWVTLVDEFLVSGEAIFRNLEDGTTRAEELGRRTPVGYLPDQFGHVGQMPQILRSCGIDRAVVWRGVPAAVTSDSFTWAAPDGSEVVALYLPFGYGQGKELPAEANALEQRLREETNRLEPFLADGHPVRIPAGDDHLPPIPALSEAVYALQGSGVDVHLTSWEEETRAVGKPSIRIAGELRSAARANLLPNTYSVRPEQKAARARAESMLERYAEPLAALVPDHPWPRDELDRAWGLLHLNGAHDSVCGCSTDEVASDVDRRTAESLALSSGVADRALRALADALKPSGTLTFNPSPFERAGVPGLGWAIDAPPRPATPLSPDRQGEWATWKCAGGQVSIAVEDRGDEGDLYNFSPRGTARTVPLRCDGSSAVADGEGFSLSIDARIRPDDDFVTLSCDLDNRWPDHRIRLLLRLPRPARSTRAGAPFEIVERPPTGEGGPGEIASPWWPARGFVCAGGSGFLTEGVVEYELTDPSTLAVTLLRATGTISRPHAIATRRSPAGPDVATPGGQSIGRLQTRLAVLLGDPGADVVRTWESFALPLMTAVAPGGGHLPATGRLFDLEVPALSSIRRDAHGRLLVRTYNPTASPANARGIGADVLRPFEIRSDEILSPPPPHRWPARR